MLVVYISMLRKQATALKKALVWLILILSKVMHRCQSAAVSSGGASMEKGALDLSAILNKIVYFYYGVHNAVLRY
jgi:hypothetical protein